jgi:hypothetical protein
MCPRAGSLEVPPTAAAQSLVLVGYLHVALDSAEPTRRALVRDRGRMAESTRRMAGCIGVTNSDACRCST